MIALVLGAGLYLGFRPQPVMVDVGTSSRGAMRVSVEQEGRTRVIDRYLIASPVAGYARRIDLHVGDSVESGAALAYIEPLRVQALDPRQRAEAQARVDAAKANVRAAEQRVVAARANMELAKKELERVLSLSGQGYISAGSEDRAKSDAERTVAELHSAEFAAAVVRHDLEAARTALLYASGGNSNGTEPVIVSSPVEGRVLKVLRESEGPVSMGQALIEIGDPRMLEVEVDLLSADAVRVQPGTKVIFERWGGDGILQGEVRVVEPVGFTKISALGVEEQRVWVIVRFTSPQQHWQRLGDGYRVEARFIVWESQNVLKIPASALFRDGDQWMAFAVDGGRAVGRSVEVGERNGLEAQVVSGLEEGISVILHPDDQISDGVRVVPR